MRWTTHDFNFKDVRLHVVFAALLRVTFGATSSCSAVSPSYAAPVVASGWEARLIANQFLTPRSIIFDSNGRLLVVQSGHGIVVLEVTDSGGACVTVTKRSSLIESTDVRTCCHYYLSWSKFCC